MRHSTKDFLTTKVAKDTKDSVLNFVLFVCFVVKICISFFGCGSAALASVEYFFTLNADEPYLEISS